MFQTSCQHFAVCLAKVGVFLGGINDIAQNNGAIDVENVYGNIVSIIELARLYKIKPVICLVFPTTYIPWRREVEDVAAKIEQLNGLLKAYAAEHRIPCINYFEDIELVDDRLPENLSADGVHPTLEGYKIMEEKILPVLK